MRISVFEDASLRILMLLAATPDRQLTSRSIAEAVGVPYNHVSKAVLKLAELGLLDSSRGRGGGVRISASGLTASVGGLLRSLDKDEFPAACRSAQGDCPLNHQCILQSALDRAKEAFYRSLDQVVIAELPHPAQMRPVLLGLPGIR
ncbi:MAG: Rrf2 family transcriptional regulator [Renibacterium salmoninarum]|nr:Rrf2 family transcriptional regulator [Renibacterium salmoninarum]